MYIESNKYNRLSSCLSSISRYLLEEQWIISTVSSESFSLLERDIPFKIEKKVCYNVLFTWVLWFSDNLISHVCNWALIFKST